MDGDWKRDRLRPRQMQVENYERAWMLSPSDEINVTVLMRAVVVYANVISI